LSDIAYSGIIRNYCFNYLDDHRKELLKFKTADDFIDDFSVSESMINGLVSLAEKEKIKVNRTVLKKITPQLRMRIKGQLARSLFDDTAMVRVSLESDPDFKRALQVAAEYREFAAVKK
jgi:carboxyl-terminal processing protease